ncbi:MAG: site-2 protease family protein [Fuerstiella sp.]|jgi:Zn-dependent protease|nr:site-2 protease family protein [Fuerstiella sp.]
MYTTDTILKFGFSLGTLGGARFRLSFLFPIALIAIIWRLDNLVLGLLATAILLFSVLVHELAHLLVARSAGGEMDEIHLWPLGGLEEPFGRGYLHDHFQTMLAGPLINLLLALSCMMTLSAAEVSPLLSPFSGFFVPFGEPLSDTAWRMAFMVNWLLFVVNLLPITPFDGGVLFRTYMSTRFTDIESRDLMARLGLVLGMFGILAGFVFDISGLVALSTFVIVLHLHENVRWYELAAAPDEFSVFDITEGSGEPDIEFFDEESSLSDGPSESTDVREEWRLDPEEARMPQEHAERPSEEQQVDDILQKLHQNGRDSLSSLELQILNRVSDKYRSRRQHN